MSDQEAFRPVGTEIDDGALAQHLLGHAHHGMTLGPITGRALAEKMLGERTIVNLGPYRPERFLI